MAHRRAGLQVGSIHKGTVSRIESFGVFVDVSEDGHSERGLVHISQLAKDRVESCRDVVEENEEVFVKVLSVDLDAEGRRKVSLSMKYCGQGDGSDRDPHMIQHEEAMRGRRSRPSEESRSLELGAVYNTRCSKCGGSGHIASECFNTGAVRYDLIPEEPAPKATKQTDAVRAPLGRGRGAVMPAWMTEESALGDSRQESRKRKAGDPEHGRDLKDMRMPKEKKAKKDKKDKKEKKDHRSKSDEHRRGSASRTHRE